MTDEKSNPKKDARGAALISYEACDMENIAATYPEEMREPFLWLAEFAREGCARNLNALEHKVKQLGLPTTAGTFSKIMRGHWAKKANGEPCPPAISLSNFLALVEALRSNPDTSAMAESINFIETPTYRLIRDYIDVRRSPNRINKFGLIIGPTGAQKTASFRYYASQPGNNRSCKWSEAPYKPKMNHFVTNLAEAYGIPAHQSLLRKLIRIRDNFNSKKCLILDNVQRLYVDPHGDQMATSSQEIFNFLQRLQDEKGFTPILSITPEFYKVFMSGLHRGFFEQFEGRVGGRHEILVLPEHAPMEDILCIAAKFGLHDAESNIEYLTKVAKMPGRIRILLQTLQTAKEDAVGDGQAFTIEHVKETLPESTVDNILKEAA